MVRYNKIIPPTHSLAAHPAFAARIDQLDADLKKTFAGKTGLQFMTFHPAWGYFAHTYGLEQVPVEVEGKAPKPAQLQGLIEHAREKGITVIFVTHEQDIAQHTRRIIRLSDGQVKTILGAISLGCIRTCQRPNEGDFDCFGRCAWCDRKNERKTDNKRNKAKSRRQGY